VHLVPRAEAAGVGDGEFAAEMLAEVAAGRRRWCARRPLVAGRRSSKHGEKPAAMRPRVMASSSFGREPD